MANGIRHTPPGKIPLDYLMYMRELRNKDLAEAVGVDDSLVSRFRQGLRPKPEIREKIAKELDVTQADLGWEEAARV